jgi:hypothetical protein
MGAVLWEVLTYNLVICAICLEKRKTCVFRVENEGSTEKNNWKEIKLRYNDMTVTGYNI